MAGFFDSGINAVGGFLSNVASGIFNANEARKNRNFQREMYDKQVQDNIKFWNMQNEYNLPSAVYQRELEGMKANNVNPLLMYGQGGVSGVTSGQINSAHPGSASAAHASFSNPFSGVAPELLEAQIRNVEADTRVKNSEAATKIDELAFNRSTWDYRKDAYYYENELKAATYFKTQAERDEAYAKTSEAYKTIDALETEMANKTRLTDQEIKESEQRITNSIKETASIITKNNAEARRNLADAYYNEAMAKIVSDPRYKNAAIKEKLEGVRRAIAEADSAEIEKAILDFKKSLLPIGEEWYNKTGYAYKKFVELTIGPLADLLGKALGGVGTQIIRNK